MAKFAILDDDTMDDKRYDSMDEALEAAKGKVSDTPDSEVEVVQIIKRVSSELKVIVFDVE
jgi:hypothetical protein